MCDNIKNALEKIGHNIKENYYKFWSKISLINLIKYK